MTGVIVFVVAIIFLAVNIIILNYSISETNNIGLIITAIVGGLVAISQFLEWKRKADDASN